MLNSDVLSSCLDLALSSGSRDVTLSLSSTFFCLPEPLGLPLFRFKGGGDTASSSSRMASSSSDSVAVYTLEFRLAANCCRRLRFVSTSGIDAVGEASTLGSELHCLRLARVRTVCASKSGDGDVEWSDIVSSSTKEHLSSVSSMSRNSRSCLQAGGRPYSRRRASKSWLSCGSECRRSSKMACTLETLSEKVISWPITE